MVKNHTRLVRFSLSTQAQAPSHVDDEKTFHSVLLLNHCDDSQLPNQDLWYTSYLLFQYYRRLFRSQANYQTSPKLIIFFPSESCPSFIWLDLDAWWNIGKFTAKMQGQRSCVAWWHKFYPFNDFFLTKSPSRTVGFLWESMTGCGVALSSVMKTPVFGLLVARFGLSVSWAGRDDWVNRLVWPITRSFCFSILFVRF